MYDSGKVKLLKKIEHLKIKNYRFERAKNFKYLGVLLHEDNNYQIHLHERITNANKTNLCYKIFSKIKTYLKS
jgi:hypothetical protein